MAYDGLVAYLDRGACLGDILKIGRHHRRSCESPALDGATGEF